jgi:regulator of sigma E protease
MDLLSWIPSFGSLAWTLVAFVVALSIIVFVHEYGHYIVGRWSGIHAEVFSIGFGPKLFSWTDKRGTVWQWAALPFGGYVRFKGDSDAASTPDGHALDVMTPTERRSSMAGAPLWARSATVAAGPGFNFAFTILILTALLLMQGIARDEAIVGAIKPLPEASQLMPGDLIVELEGKPVEDLSGLMKLADDLIPGPQTRYTVERDGRTLQVDGPFPFPPVAFGIHPQSAAQDAGMREGDVITAVDGAPIHAFSELRRIIAAGAGKEVTLTLWRAGETLEVSLSPRRVDLPLPDGGFEERFLIGLSGGPAFMPELRGVGPFEAVGLAAQQTWGIIQSSLSGLWNIVTGAISSCNLRGPIGIAETSAATASMGLESFIRFIALLSTAVGLMNLFPVPVLDGGHLVFHAWEAVTGKPPSDKILRGLMTAGFVLLMSLMFFALTNDLLCP